MHRVTRAVIIYNTPHNSKFFILCSTRYTRCLYNINNFGSEIFHVFRILTKLEAKIQPSSFFLNRSWA